MRKNLLAVSTLILAASLFLVLRGWSRPALPFPHGKHIEAGLECATCHPAAESNDLRASLLPKATTCTAECHQQDELKKWGWAEIPEKASGFQSFPHSAHLAQGQTCDDCHGYLVHPEWAAQGKGMADHALCFTCHDGLKQANDCESCHSNLREGRLSGSQRDPVIFKPMNHHPGFLHDHQFAARLDGSQCRDCHRQEDFCSTCHQGDNVTVMVHERNWLYTHPVSARKNLQDCESCHDLGNDCAECHNPSGDPGIAPMDHTSAWMRGGPAHAQAARHDVAVCASCHEQDENCAQCHQDPDGVRGTQTSRNIHPSGFRDEAGHGYWHEDESASCFSCHVNTREAGRDFCGYCHGEK